MTKKEFIKNMNKCIKEVNYTEGYTCIALSTYFSPKNTYVCYSLPIRRLYAWLYDVLDKTVDEVIGDFSSGMERNKTQRIILLNHFKEFMIETKLYKYY